MIIVENCPNPQVLSVHTDFNIQDNPAFPIVQGYCGKIQFGDIEILTFISDNFSSLQESDQYSA